VAEYVTVFDHAGFFYVLHVGDPEALPFNSKGKWVMSLNEIKGIDEAFADVGQCDSGDRLVERSASGR
jgi:hypothetical protein